MCVCACGWVCVVAFGPWHYVFGCLQGVDCAFDMQMNRFYSQWNQVGFGFTTPHHCPRPLGEQMALMMAEQPKMTMTPLAVVSWYSSSPLLIWLIWPPKDFSARPKKGSKHTPITCQLQLFQPQLDSLGKQAFQWPAGRRRCEAWADPGADSSEWFTTQITPLNRQTCVVLIIGLHYRALKLPERTRLAPQVGIKNAT